MSEKKCEFVKEKDCDQKHKNSRAVLGLLVGIVALLLTLTGLVFASSNNTSDRVVEMKGRMDNNISEMKDDLGAIKVDLATHISAQVESEKHLTNTLEDLRDSMDANTSELHRQGAEQKVIMERILNNHP